MTYTRTNFMNSYENSEEISINYISTKLVLALGATNQVGKPQLIKNQLSHGYENI